MLKQHRPFLQFDFGKNWLEFSKKAMTPEKVTQAREDLAWYMNGLDLSGRWFLDIGFGQGLTLLLAREMGARVVGCDINPQCLQALEQNSAFFPAVRVEPNDVLIGSILREDVVETLRSRTPDSLGYHIVHSWGVLHHTGDMWSALAIASSLVRKEGYLAVAIYNRHWTSPAWLCIKWIYNKAPLRLRSAMILLFSPLIFLAKWAWTGKDPRIQERGMDFYFNVIDWIGGYPYEYAHSDQIMHNAESLGFKCIRFKPATVPTGCNQFLFKKISG